jgi:membrane fusion protein (multidrug efflux system)
LAEAQASIAAHEAEVAFRRSEHGRIAELVRSRSVNEAIQDEKLKHLRAAESALAAAQARVQSMEAEVKVEGTRRSEAKSNLVFAQSQLRVAETNHEQTTVLMQYAQIRALYDGLVTRRWLDSGNFVASAAATKSEPLFTIERVDKLRIVFDLPESESGLMEIGQLATLRVDALKNHAFVGRVQRTAGVLDPKTRTLRVEAELDEPSPILRPGMYGIITVTLASAASGN